MVFSQFRETVWLSVFNPWEDLLRAQTEPILYLSISLDRAHKDLKLCHMKESHIFDKFEIPHAVMPDLFLLQGPLG